MSLPNPMRRGSAISAHSLTSIADESRVRTLSGGRGVQQRGGGIIISRRRSDLTPQIARTRVISYPFDIAVRSAEEGFLVSVRPGTINSVVASNYLDEFAVEAEETAYIILTATVASGSVTSAELSADSDPPEGIGCLAGQPPSIIPVLIGVVVAGVPYKTWGSGSIQALPIEAFRTQKASPTVGQVPYDVYYTWELKVQFSNGS